MGLLGNCSACERPIHENACVTYLCTDDSGREYTENYHFECKPYISTEYPWVMEFAYDVGKPTDPPKSRHEWHWLDAHETLASAKVVLKCGAMSKWATDMAITEGKDTTVTVRIVDTREHEHLGPVVACRAWDSVGCCQSTYVAEDYSTLWDMS